MADDPDYSFDILEARYAIEASTAWHAAMRHACEKKRFSFVLKQRSAKTRISPHKRTFVFIWRLPKPPHNIVLLQTMRGFFDVLQSFRSIAASGCTWYPSFSQLTEQHQAVIDAILPVMLTGRVKQ